MIILLKFFIVFCIDELFSKFLCSLWDVLVILFSDVLKFLNCFLFFFVVLVVL